MTYLKGADIAYSPDDGGYWVELWELATRDALPLPTGVDSPIFAAKSQAEQWAREHGATTLLYP